MGSQWFKRAEDINRMNRDIASQAEAEAGTNNEKIITPLRMGQGIAALASGAGVGFDTLSKFLVVDATFTSATAGWGVTAFDKVAAAQPVAVDGDVILINGRVVETVSYIAFAADVTIAFTGISQYQQGWVITSITSGLTANGAKVKVLGGVISGGAATKIHCVGGGEFAFDGVKIDNAEIEVSAASGGSSIIVENCTMVEDTHSRNITVKDSAGSLIVRNSSLTTSGYAIELDALPAVLEVSNSKLHGDNYGIRSPSALTGIELYHCDINLLDANVAIDPLNHSNTVGDITHREVVAVASLPAAAAGNAGAMAATSDGGTGSIPALMYSNGSAWVVAAE